MLYCDNEEYSTSSYGIGTIAALQMHHTAALRALISPGDSKAPESKSRVVRRGKPKRRSKRQQRQQRRQQTLRRARVHHNCKSKSNSQQVYCGICYFDAMSVMRAIAAAAPQWGRSLGRSIATRAIAQNAQHQKLLQLRPQSSVHASITNCSHRRAAFHSCTSRFCCGNNQSATAIALQQTRQLSATTTSGLSAADVAALGVGRDDVVIEQDNETQTINITPTALLAQHQTKATDTDTAADNSSISSEPRTLIKTAVGSLDGKLMTAFTCTKCETRSVRLISKQSYYHGVVLVRCSGCESLHLFADHLHWFDDKSTTIESICQEHNINYKFVTDSAQLNEDDRALLRQPHIMTPTARKLPTQ